MPIIQLFRTSRPITGDDRDWKREKDKQIREIQDAVERHDRALFNENRRT